MWGDLGRYRRVVNLHRTARIVVEEHGGEVPSDPEILTKLPGIGPYTAGAVACFAFERDVAGLATMPRPVRLLRARGRRLRAKQVGVPPCLRISRRGGCRCGGL